MITARVRQVRTKLMRRCNKTMKQNNNFLNSLSNSYFENQITYLMRKTHLEYLIFQLAQALFVLFIYLYK